MNILKKIFVDVLNFLYKEFPQWKVIIKLITMGLGTLFAVYFYVTGKPEFVRFVFDILLDVLATSASLAANLLS